MKWKKNKLMRNYRHKFYQGVCISCGNFFDAKSIRKIWCSDKCRKKEKRAENRVKKVMDLRNAGINKLSQLKLKSNG